MTLSARTSQDRQVTGAPVSSTAARASSAARDWGAQMRTTPARSAVATFWPPGEKAAATTGASCPCSSSLCRVMSCRASPSWLVRESGLAVASPVLLDGISAAPGLNGLAASGVSALADDGLWALSEALLEGSEAATGVPLGCLHREAATTQALADAQRSGQVALPSKHWMSIVFGHGAKVCSPSVWWRQRSRAHSGGYRS